MKNNISYILFNSIMISIIFTSMYALFLTILISPIYLKNSNIQGDWCVEQKYKDFYKFHECLEKSYYLLK